MHPVRKRLLLVVIWRFVFLLHVWFAGEVFVDEACASLCTALEQNKTLTSFTLVGMLCSGVCSVQVIGVLWCKVQRCCDHRPLV